MVLKATNAARTDACQDFAGISGPWIAPCHISCVAYMKGSRQLATVAGPSSGADIRDMVTRVCSKLLNAKLGLEPRPISESCIRWIVVQCAATTLLSRPPEAYSLLMCRSFVPFSGHEDAEKRE